MTLKNLLFRSLRKLRDLSCINSVKRITYSEHRITIPVINGLGYTNLFLEPNWFQTLINELLTVDDAGFVDVGANVGQTLIAVKSLNRPVHYTGFDPNVACCYYLRSLINVNGFTAGRVYNIALSDTLKEAFLKTNVKAHPTGSVVTNLHPKFYEQ